MAEHPPSVLGAMENWGLIVAGTVPYLLDQRSSSILDKRRRFKHQAHEVAHQWYLYWLWLATST